MTNPLHSNLPLKHLVAEEAVSSPFSYAKAELTVRGCLYDGEGKLISLSQRVSGKAGERLTNVDPTRYDERWAPQLRIEEDCIYLGNLMTHYGHFITETLSSFWALALVPKETRVIFHPFIFGTKAQPFMEPFFEAFRLPASRVTILEEPTVFRRILVPERSFHINHRISAQFTDIMKSLRLALALPKSKPRRIYLSRSRTRQIPRAYDNAAETDSLMNKLGLEVVHPQELSMRKQLELYASTELVVGFSGSALHNCLFMPPEARLIEIGDRRSPVKRPLTQQMCELAMGLDSAFIPAWPRWSSDDANYDLDYLASALTKVDARISFSSP